jgi:RND family efflux transporter MFP subunit
MSDHEHRNPPQQDRHLYGRRAYDHGPPPGADDGHAPAATGDTKGNGRFAETHALQKSEPRALQRAEHPEHEPAPPPEARQRSPHGQHDGRAGGAQKHQPRPHVSARLPRLLLIGLIVALIVAALAAALLFWRHHHRLATEADRRSQEVDRGPKVFVTAVRNEPGARELTLPADVRGFSQATVYAKVAGYVRSIAVDKGDAVEKGQLLAVLESPEVDQQVAAAVADLAVKKRTYERYRHLVAKDFVSQQEFDTAQAQYEVAQANLKQARAMQEYETLRAPFAGTITARYVDPGALVPAATGSTQSALPLVDIADLDRLRILLFVQQDAAPFIHAGDVADISVDERPDLHIQAPITRVSQALDPRSRTMLCEIWLANEHRLYPGTFVHVTLRLKMPAYPMVPSAALVIHDNKPSLAVVRGDQVHFVPVKPGLDDGHNVQIKEGAKPGDRVALDLPAELADGARVQPEEKKDPEKQEGGAQAGQRQGGGQRGAQNGAKGGQGEKQDEQGGAQAHKQDRERNGKRDSKRGGSKRAANAGNQPNGSATSQKPEKPKSPAERGSGKLSDDPMAGGSQ